MFKQILIFGILWVSMLTAYEVPFVIQPMTQAESARYYRELEAEVIKAQQLEVKVAKESEKVSHDPGTYGLHVAEYQEASQMAMIKADLLINMRDGKSMSSPVIRDELLVLMKQESISIGELDRFIKKVEAVKAQIDEEGEYE